MGCNIYIHTDLHERIIRRGHNPSEYVNKTIEEALDEEDAKENPDLR